MMMRLSTAILLILLSVNCLMPARSEATTIREMAGRTVAGKGKATYRQFACLPDTFDLNEVIAYRTMPGGKEVAIKLKDKLAELKATCRDGKLVDPQKREIKLFRLACFGNPPADYDEIQQREQQELSRLQKHYKVIIIGCNPHIQ